MKMSQLLMTKVSLVPPKLCSVLASADSASTSTGPLSTSEVKEEPATSSAQGRHNRATCGWWAKRWLGWAWAYWLMVGG